MEIKGLQGGYNREGHIQEEGAREGAREQRGGGAEKQMGRRRRGDMDGKGEGGI